MNVVITNIKLHINHKCIISDYIKPLIFWHKDNKNLTILNFDLKAAK
jgi:hypothetical protein